MRGDRLGVDLTYDGDAADSFDWQLFTADELVDMAHRHDLECRLRCTDFDERRPIGGAECDHATCLRSCISSSPDAVSLRP